MDTQDMFNELFQAYADNLEAQAKNLRAVSDLELEKALKIGSNAYGIFHPIALAADRLVGEAKSEMEFRTRKKA